MGRAIVEGSTRIGKIGLAGYPGYIFLQKIRYGYGHQRYDEKRTILHNWYSALRSYLWVIYKMDDTSNMYTKKKVEYTTIIKPLLSDVAKEISIARKLYKSTFEDPTKYDPLESQFEEVLEGIEERLDDITAITHIIDKGRADDYEDEIPAG
jgi:hypothetical protein